MGGGWASCLFLDVFIFWGEGVVGFMPLFRCIYFFGEGVGFMPLFRCIYFCIYVFLKVYHFFLIYIFFFAFWGDWGLGLMHLFRCIYFFGGRGWWALCLFLDVFIFLERGWALCLFLDVFIYLFHIYFYLFFYIFFCFLGDWGLGLMPLFRCIYFLYSFS